ncbi:metal-sensitive transcriptional regulator [Leeia sp. TBRC 13508]|uniref:Metal-sensitive transcriptional regulator n=1 Tax=Leeia speluncae TaxID=2884804 RepID=A0ABS8D159_9NEIS|nr:metal-sensitive transcriptional regulator [Leeia speluncae]MCB6181942.1 metal-sensitive transcriptional regulator [Leeia speluncae]
MSSDKTENEVGCSSCDSTPTKHTQRDNKDKLIKRLNRIEGQVRGISRMIEDDRYCIDVLTQISAAHSALDAIAKELLAHHAKGCVSKAIQEGEGEAAVQELLQVMERWIR